MPEIIEEQATCTWLVERRNPMFDAPPECDWYPDSPSDLTVIVDCGAKLTVNEDGSWHCEAGHGMGTLEQELGPFGNEWQREMEDRYAGRWD